MVIWLLGLSGSGKTTLGRKLQSYLEEISIPHYMIDGDDARSFFENDLGDAYSKQIGLYKETVVSNESLNEKYLNGEIISPDHFDYNIIDTPNPAKLSNAKMQKVHYTTY